MKVYYNQCPVCGNNDISFFMECRDHLLTGESFPIYHCPECFLNFTQAHPDENEENIYYESQKYIPHSDSDKSFTGKLYYAIRRIMLRRKKSLVLAQTKKRIGSLLDFGSGTGHFAATMKKSGWNVTGIELNEKARKYSSDNFGITAISPHNIASLPSGYFDCITFWHVLEHLQNLSETTFEIKRLLKPDGVVLIALPNNTSSDSNYYRNFWAAYDVPRHLWHFNPVSFISFAARSGFEVKLMKGLPFDVFYISILSEKYRGSRIAFLSGLIKGIIFYILSLFDFRLSSSIVYIIKPISLTLLSSRLTPHASSITSQP
ncbi:MAG: methyltransferase domain-containing protein [Bacteroidales bacterium]